MEILITGGAGFIGSNLAIYLQNNFAEVSVTVFDFFDDGSELNNGNKRYLGSYKNLIGFEGIVVCGDVGNWDDYVFLQTKKFDIIFHLAAISDTRATNENMLYRSNINSFYNIIKLARINDAKLVYASSAAVYGNSGVKSVDIGDEAPDNPYAFSKFAMDSIANSLRKSNMLTNIIGLRYFNVYGHGESSKLKTSSTIFQFAQQIINGKQPILFEGSDFIKRDFIYIKDVVQATVKAGFSNSNGVFNIGTGISRSFLDVFLNVRTALNSDIEPIYIANPFNSGYQYYTQANIERAVDGFNFQPSFSLEEGIQDYLKDINYFRYEK